MPQAAVPRYLGSQFEHASPGQRFGLYLPLWDEQWRIAKEGADMRSTWQAITALNPNDRATLKSLLERQQAACATQPADACLVLSARLSAPLTTGLGNEHPLENGFAFLNPYGLPYLPGSGIKGALRQAARELASGTWGDAHGWNAERCYPVQVEGQRVSISLIDALFGYEPADGETEHLRGAMQFWDVIPQIEGTQLLVEILTPHQAHYYANKGRDTKTGASASPHDSGQPTPNKFLTLPPSTRLVLHMVCDQAHLQRLLPSDCPWAAPARWKALLQAAFEHCGTWLGMGAKTAVGYGAFERDAKHEAELHQKLENTQKQAAESQRLAQMTPQQRAVHEWVRQCEKKKQDLRGKLDKPNTALHEASKKLVQQASQEGNWSAADRAALADAIETWLPQVVQIDAKEARKSLKLAQLRGSA